MRREESGIGRRMQALKPCGSREKLRIISAGGADEAP
jgi:hypothetical protein